MKRTTAIIFLILANFIILVHAVVPHHHHYHQDIYSHHDSDCCSNSVLLSLAHGGDDCSHSDAEKDICKLQDLLSKLVLNTKERETFVAVSEYDYQNYYIASLLIPDVSTEPQICKVRYRTYSATLPQSRGVLSPDLRAPPAC